MAETDGWTTPGAGSAEPESAPEAAPADWVVATTPAAPGPATTTSTGPNRRTRPTGPGWTAGRVGPGPAVRGLGETGRSGRSAGRHRWTGVVAHRLVPCRRWHRSAATGGERPDRLRASGSVPRKASITSVPANSTSAGSPLASTTPRSRAARRSASQPRRRCRARPPGGWRPGSAAPGGAARPSPPPRVGPRRRRLVEEHDGGGVGYHRGQVHQAPRARGELADERKGEGLQPEEPPAARRPGPRTAASVETRLGRRSAGVQRVTGVDESLEGPQAGCRGPTARGTGMSSGRSAPRPSRALAPARWRWVGPRE